MTAIDLFYAYGIFFILNSIYYKIKLRLQKDGGMDFNNLDPKQNSPEEILKVTQEEVERISAIGVVVTILDIVWNAYGIFFTEHWVLFLLFFLTTVFMVTFMIGKPKKEQKIISNLFTLIKILIVLTIVYLHFSPLFLQG